MFTGIIEEIGEIISMRKGNKSASLTVKCAKVTGGLQIGDSVSVDGICVTVVKLNNREVVFDLSPETLSISTAGFFKKGGFVNLERAAKLGAGIGGHLVSGHVDGLGKIIAIKKSGNGANIEISLPKALNRYIIDKGSVAIDGISLTVAKQYTGKISLALIPHTINSTTLKFKRAGMPINIECDQVGKYIEKFIRKGSKPVATGTMEEAFPIYGE